MNNNESKKLIRTLCHRALTRKARTVEVEVELRDTTASFEVNSFSDDKKVGWKTVDGIAGYRSSLINHDVFEFVEDEMTIEVDNKKYSLDKGHISVSITYLIDLNRLNGKHATSEIRQENFGWLRYVNDEEPDDFLIVNESFLMGLGAETWIELNIQKPRKRYTLGDIDDCSYILSYPEVFEKMKKSEDWYAENGVTFSEVDDSNCFSDVIDGCYTYDKDKWEWIKELVFVIGWINENELNILEAFKKELHGSTCIDDLFDSLEDRVSKFPRLKQRVSRYLSNK